MENPFKHRTAETPRSLTPEQLEQARVATEAAVVEGLGTRPLPETLGNEELVSAGAETLSQRDVIKREQATPYETLTTSCGEKAEKEFAALVEGKDTQTPAVRAAIGDLEHVIKNEESLGGNSSPVLNAILSLESMHELEDRTTDLFTTEIQQAIRTYRTDMNMLAERERVPSAVGARIQQEIDSRKEA